MMKLKTLKDLADEITKEVARAQRLHPCMNSGHEGYAVIKEELDELWDEIKKKTPDEDKLEEEAIQVAAMAMRFVLNVVWGFRS